MKGKKIYSSLFLLIFSVTSCDILKTSFFNEAGIASNESQDVHINNDITEVNNDITEVNNDITEDNISKDENDVSNENEDSQIEETQDLIEEEIKSFSLSKEKIELEIGVKLEEQVAYSVEPTNCKENIKWYVDDTTIANINNELTIAAIKAGQTELIVYNDSNSNDIFDEDELNHIVPIYVHDFINCEIKKVEPTCVLNGYINKICACGCGKTKNEIIPATNHEFDSGSISKEPTCAESGIITHKCVHSNCNATYDENIEPLAHTPIEIDGGENLAEGGTTISKPKYYHTCEVCNKQLTSTFEKGNSDYFATIAPKNIFKSEDMQYFYEYLYRYFYQELEKYRYSDVEETSSGYLSFDSRNQSDIVLPSGGDLYPTLKQILETQEPQNIGDYHSYYNCDMLAAWLPVCLRSQSPRHWWFSMNNYDWAEQEFFPTGSYSRFKMGINYKFADGIEKVTKDLRKRYDYCFDEVNKQVDKLIRPGASDFEKALIIYIYTGHKIVYKSQSCRLGETLETLEGNCVTFTELYNYLAQRYGLASYSALSLKEEHAWNFVCIDGLWYSLDTTNHGRSVTGHIEDFARTISYPSWKNVYNENTEPGNPFISKDEYASKNGNLFARSVSLYKDNKIYGYYYKFDEAIKNIDDSSAEYKLLISASSIANYSINPYVMYTDNKNSPDAYKSTVSNCSFKSLYLDIDDRNTNYGCQDKPTIKLPSSFKNRNKVSYNSNKVIVSYY